jgi:hypothetical protein
VGGVDVREVRGEERSEEVRSDTALAVSEAFIGEAVAVKRERRDRESKGMELMPSSLVFAFKLNFPLFPPLLQVLPCPM